MWELVLWQRIVLYIIIIIDLYIFVKLSQLRVGRYPLIKLHWRVLIAVLFPLIFTLAFLFAGILLAAALTVLFILFLFSLFRGKKNIRIKFF